MVRIVKRISCLSLLTFMQCFHCKRLLKDYAVACLKDRMDIQIEFGEPFDGVIFADQAYNDSACRWEGQHTTKLNFSMPVSMSNGESACSSKFKQTTGEVTSLLVISPMKNILVDGVISLQVRCLYAINDITITMSGLQLIGADERAGVASGNGDTPKLHIRILDGHGIIGQPVTHANVGQRLTLDIVLEDTAIYDFYAHSCIAHDGTNNVDASIQIIDTNGCGIALPRAIEAPVYTANPTNDKSKHVYIYMYGFQFTSSHFVHFECQARPCIHSCKREQCETINPITLQTTTTTASRVRRESQMMGMKLLAVLEMRSPTQTYAKNFYTNPNDKLSSTEATCLPSILLTSLLIGAGLMPTLTLIICYAVTTHRRKQTTDVHWSSSHSGIYSDSVSCSPSDQ